MYLLRQILFLGAIASATSVAAVPSPCSDTCLLGATTGTARCEAWNPSTAGWISQPDDGEGGLHHRARFYTTWLHDWMMPAGGVMSTYFTDDELEEVQAYGGRRDSAIWTGTYLAAESLRFAVTGAGDAARWMRASLETLHTWWRISGDPGYLARYAAPANSPQPILDILPADDAEVHRDVLYQGEPWHWRGNISRDQYQGVLLGYSLAYATTDSPELRELIRDDVVTFVEQLMRSDQTPVRVVVNGQPLTTSVRVPYAVFSRAETGGETPALTLQTSPFDAAGEGILFFTPDAAELIRQLPGFASFPSVPQATQAIQLGAIFNIALQVTEGVADYAERRQAIADHYAQHVDQWLDIAVGWRNTNRCDEGYFGLNIAFMPLYNWLRLETDPTRKARLQRELLRDALWASVADHKNVFFAFLYAAMAAPEDDTQPVIQAHVDQLARFPTAPNLAVPVDLRGTYAESTSCPGIAAVAVNVDERVPASFTWERHPWKLFDDGHPNQAYGGVDYLIAYWLGRYHGFIAEDAPDTCLFWRRQRASD